MRWSDDMNDKTILILGGYGNTGQLIAQLLLQETDLRLILAGRSEEKAQSVAAHLNSSFPGKRAIGIRVDASDTASMKRALQGIDLVLVASSTARYARETAIAALEAGIDYLDIQYSTQKINALKSISTEIEKAGLCFITDGGFHPGLPAALVRYAALSFDRLEKANIGSVIKVDWSQLNMPDETVHELIEELNDFVPLKYKDGQWVKVKMLGMGDFLTMDFGGEFGRQYCAPMFLEEMRLIPELIPSIQETGFFVGGFNWFVDWLVMPIATASLKMWPKKALKPMGKLMKWGLIKFSKPPYGTMLKLEARGEKSGQQKSLELILSHADGYVLTAIPVVACLLQYMDGSVQKPGLWTQANIVEPVRFFQDMKRMGVEIKTL